jgi:hypothetical protein
MPQVASLVSGMDPLDPEFRRKWSACLEWIGQRLFAPTRKSGDALEREEADEPPEEIRAPIQARRMPEATRRSKRGVKSNR